MAEDPTFSGMSSGDAAESFAKVTSQIKSDMAAIEASAKNIELSLNKASKHSIGGGSSFGAANAGGGTGFGNDTGMKLGQITSQLGGARGIGTVAGFGLGSIGGGIAGGIAVAGLPDLIIRPERALGMENARFGIAQATGTFSSFQNIMDTARNRFNVQNEQAFLNTMVYGTQRAGMVGMLGGGTVGERRAGAQIGGYNTLAAMAGIDQSAVPGMMQSALSAPAYYASMASGVMTRDPVTGEPISIEGQINQQWKYSGLEGMSTEQALRQIDINYGEGSGGLADLRGRFGGNEELVQTYIEGLRIRAKTGQALKPNQVQDQAKEAGILGTEMTQGNEGTRGLESEKMAMGAEYLNDATAGIEEATKHITNAVTLLKDLEGPLRDIVAGYTTLANQMDVFQTELPGATKGITDFFTGLPGLLMTYLLGKKGLPGLPDVPMKDLPKVPGMKLLGKVGLGLGAGGLTFAGTSALEKKLQGMELKWMPGWLRSALQVAWDTGQGGLTAGAATLATTKNPLAALVALVAGSVAGGGASVQDWYTNEGGHQGRGRGTPEGRSKGDWFVESDQDSRIHYGEMVLPNRVANAVREELAVGRTATPGSSKRNDGTTVNIYLTVQKASDQEAISFAQKVKKIIDMDEELLAIGSGRLGAYA